MDLGTAAVLIGILNGVASLALALGKLADRYRQRR